MDANTVSRCYYVIRRWLGSFLAAEMTQLMGGDRLVVVMDETWLGKRRRSHIRGRRTFVSQKLLIGAVEMDLATRRLTGRCFVRCVRNRRRATIEHLVRACVRPGTEIWTDEWVGYAWMDEANSDYYRVAVNHSKGVVYVHVCGRVRVDV